CSPASTTTSPTRCCAATRSRCWSSTRSPPAGPARGEKTSAQGLTVEHLFGTLCPCSGRFAMWSDRSPGRAERSRGVPLDHLAGTRSAQGRPFRWLPASAQRALDANAFPGGSCLPPTDAAGEERPAALGRVERAASFHERGRTRESTAAPGALIAFARTR